MTTEYFRVRNGLAVGEDIFTVDAATGDVVVGGNLTVNGDTTTLNTTELQIEDNKVTLNSNVTASPTLDAGIIVERGTSTDSAINWNETTDKWEQNRAGTSTVIAVSTDELAEGTSNKYYSDTLVNSHLSGGTGVTYTDGVIAIGQSVATTASPTFVDITHKNLIKGAIRSHPTGLSSGDIYAGYNGGNPAQGILLDNSNDITKRAALILRGYGNRTVHTFERANGTVASPTNITTGAQLWESHSTGYVGGSNSGWIGDKIAAVPALIRTIASENWDDGLNKTGTRFQVILSPPSTPLTTSSSLPALNVGLDFINYNSDSHFFKAKSGSDLMNINASTGEVFINNNLTVSNSLNAANFYGNGSGLTNLPNPFNQSLNTTDNATFVDVNSTNITNSANITTKNIIKGAIRSHPTGLTSGDIYAGYNNPVGIQGILLDNSSDTSKRSGIVQRAYGQRTIHTVEKANGTASSPTGLTSGTQLWESHSTGYVGGSNSGWIGDKVSNVPAVIRTVASENWDDGLNKTGARFQVILQPPSTPLTTTSNLVVLNAGTDSINYNSDSHYFNTKTGSNVMSLGLSNSNVNSDVVTFSSASGNNSIYIDNANKSINMNNAGTGLLQLGDVNIAQMGSTFQSVYAPGFKYTGLMSTSTQQGGSYFEISSRWKTASTDTDFSTPLNGWGLGQFGFSANSGTDNASQKPAGGIAIKATENWDATHYGSRFVMSANILGNGGQREVLSFSPESAIFSSDSHTLRSSSGTTFVEIDNNTAKFNRPVQLPSYTATAANAITGAVGQMIAITNSSGGSNPNGMIAFWDTSNSRWSYIHDNSAI